MNTIVYGQKTPRCDPLNHSMHTCNMVLLELSQTLCMNRQLMDVYCPKSIDV